MTSCSKTKLSIGCNDFTLAYWKKEYKNIGKANNYTEAEIKEYGLYIDLAIKLSKLK